MEFLAAVRGATAIVTHYQRCPTMAAEVDARPDESTQQPELLHLSVKRKKTGQICWREKSSVSGLELGSLAGFFAFYLVQSVHAPHSS